MNPLTEVATRVDDALAHFLERRAADLVALDPDLAALAEPCRRLALGGKRLRPAFCWWGYQCVATPADPDALVRATASLDLLHASALAHDDLIDGSDTRRGAPAAHRALAVWHTERGGIGAADDFGAAGAILVGDLLLMYSAELFDASGLPGLDRARPLLAALRTEVTAGQFLDITTGAVPPAPTAALARARQIMEYKTSRYTVARPLQMGAALADGSDALITALGELGSPLGRAFQLRDDVLGCFGDPERTGKPTGDDLREGKRTVLVAEALARLGADAAELETLLVDRALNAAGIAQAQDLIRASGALDATEQHIAADLADARTRIAALNARSEAIAALDALAVACVDRDR